MLKYNWYNVHLHVYPQSRTQFLGHLLVLTLRKGKNISNSSMSRYNVVYLDETMPPVELYFATLFFFGGGGGGRGGAGGGGGAGVLHF